MIDSGLDRYGLQAYQSESQTDRRVTLKFASVGESTLLSYTDPYSLQDFQKIDSYSVRSNGIRSKLKNGGYVIDKKDGAELVVALNDLEVRGNNRFIWEDANSACSESRLNCYRDWRLPNKEELNLILLHKRVIGGIAGDYWISEKDEHDDYSLLIRQVRVFDNRDVADRQRQEQVKNTPPVAFPKIENEKTETVPAD